jgi:hypothetical protein
MYIKIVYQRHAILLILLKLVKHGVTFENVHLVAIGSLSAFLPSVVFKLYHFCSCLCRG